MYLLLNLRWKGFLFLHALFVFHSEDQYQYLHTDDLRLSEDVLRQFRSGSDCPGHLHFCWGSVFIASRSVTE